MEIILNPLKKNVALLFAACFPLIVLAQPSPVFDPRSVELSWQFQQNDYENKPQFLATIQIKSTDGMLPRAGWKLFFNLRYHGANLKSLNHDLEIDHVNGELFSIVPSATFSGIPKGQAVVIPFVGRGKIANYQDVPSGFFWVNEANPEKAFSMKNPAIVPSNNSSKLPEADGTTLFQKQSSTENIADDKLVKVFPTPVSYRETGDYFNLDANTVVEDHDEFKNEVQYLRAQLLKLFGKSPAGNSSAKKILFRKNAGSPEAYQLSVAKQSVIVSAADAAGIFCGIQSFQSLFPSDVWKNRHDVVAVPTVEVSDSPRFPWRAFMLDVSRNFQPKEKILKLIDVMALYKMNVFHFHLNDDEGWRLEIRDLPELTDVGAVRGYPFENGERLQPSYGSGVEQASSGGSGYYSRKDFVDILRYATERHVKVIPEIESPGHARAAVKAMEFRYRKFMSRGDRREADRYRLHDPADQSKYISAQLFNDNVMNAALPSTYSFIEKVIDDLQAMYKEAHAPLTMIHMGGDEVPEGAWIGSPVVQNLMKTDVSIKNVNDLWRSFFVRVKNMLNEKGLALYGWEELVMDKTGSDHSRAISPTAEFIRDGGQVDAWWNDRGHEEVPYKIANAGYKVVLTLFDYFYFDLSNLPDFHEPGDAWVGYLDIQKTFSFIPYNYYRNSKADMAGTPYPDNYFQNKERLKDESRKNVMGIQGALWGENLNSPELMEYQTYPRLLAVAERAWAKEPTWSSISDPKEYNEQFNRDWSMFANVLGKRELPKLDFYNHGYGYRVPPPGAKIVNGKVVASTLFPGLVVRYTTDGSEPTTKSILYASPISNKGVIRMKCFATDDKSSATIILENK